MRALSRETTGEDGPVNGKTRFGQSAQAGRIRRARAADAAAIVALEEHFPGDRLSLRSVRRFLNSPNACVWMAQLNGAPAGNLILLTRKNSRIARIYSVVVAPAARGRGLARRLVAVAEAQARRLGSDAVALEVRTDNRAARALYAGLGYVEVARLPEYYEDGAAGLRLVKQLRR